MVIKGVKYAWYSTRFWQFFTLMIFGNFFGCFFAYSFKTFGESEDGHKQISDTTMTWAASIGGGCINGLSRVVYGAIVDKSSFKLLFTILMAV